MFGWLKRVLGTDRTAVPTTVPDGDGPAVAVREIYQRRNEIDAADGPGGPVFVVHFAEHVAAEPITLDPWELLLGTRLRIIFRVTPEADPIDLRQVDRDNITGSLEDEFCRFACPVRPTRENCLALQATRLPWTEAAERLAAPLLGPPGAVDAVVAAMTEDWRRHCELRGWFSKSSG
jgi:hypothetical protein